MGVYLIWDLFELENGPIFPSGPIASINKVFINVYQKFLQKTFGISDHQNLMDYNTWTLAKWGFIYFASHFNLKMGLFDHRDKLTPLQRSYACPWIFFCKKIRILDHQKSMDYRTQKLAKWRFTSFGACWNWKWICLLSEQLDPLLSS